MATSEFIFDNAINKYLDSQPRISIIFETKVFSKITTFTINGVPILDRKEAFSVASEVESVFRQLPAKNALANVRIVRRSPNEPINVRKIKWLDPEMEITLIYEVKTERSMEKGIALIGPILLEFYIDLKKATTNCDFVWHNGVRKFGVHVARITDVSMNLEIPSDFLARVAARFPELGGDVFRNMLVLVFDQMRMLTLNLMIAEGKFLYNPLVVDDFVKTHRFH
ncbi:hypothetical protein BJ742DRAFT_844367 [Cladochytrium replicatum]|nr:hypothetical protein BJ742DRAFT_844367 [Cladochytrium replicatum]